MVAAFGQFSAHVVGNAESNVAIRGSVRIAGDNSKGPWPGAAYIGLQQGSTEDSIQIFVVLDDSGGHAIVGHRLISHGMVIKTVEQIAVERSQPLRFSIVFNNGLVLISVNDEKVITERTLLRQVAPYLSVSSGTAEFKFTVFKGDKVRSTSGSKAVRS